jgi:hypothetical protein
LALDFELLPCSIWRSVLTRMYAASFTV